MTVLPSNSRGSSTNNTGRHCVRVLIVDDLPQVRSDLRLMLELTDHIEIVGEAADGSQAVALAETFHPDVVIADLEMPVMDGLEAARQITTRGLAGKVILLTIHSGSEIRRQALESGVSDFINKGDNIEQLIQTILERR